MQGSIYVEHLKISCIIGVHPNERVTNQNIFVDLKIQFDMAACIVSDQIRDTIDYVKVADICKEIAQKGKFKLLESYAGAVIEALQQHYNPTYILIKVKKPLALANAEFAIVELEKFNQGTPRAVDISHRFSETARR